MASFGEMLSNLQVQTRAELTDADLKQIINNAQRQIVEAYEWSYCYTNVVINSVAPKQNGKVTLSTGSPQVLGVDCSFTVNDVGSFFWAGGLQLAPCPIVDVQGKNALTLEVPWPGPPMQLSAYILAPLYYRVEGALEVRAVRAINELEKRTREEINAADPCRVAFGGAPALCWCPAPYDQSGTLQIELWPVCQDARWYLCDVKRRAPFLTRPTDNPLCPSAVLEAKSLMDASLAAYASSGNAQWLELANKYEARFLKEWEDNQIADARKMRHLKQTSPPRPVPFPYDAGYTPTHNDRRGYY